MDSYLQQLENNEAILLMYLNDELPPQDRVEVEQMLSSDAILRGNLEALRHAQQTAMAAMEALDRGVSMPVSPAVAVRQVVREMNRRKLQVIAQPAIASAKRRMPWWSWALPTAAAAMLGFVIWTVYHPSNNSIAGGRNLRPNFPTFVPHGPHELSDQEKFAMLKHSFDATAADNEDDLSLSLVASKPDDMDLGLDPIHGSSSDSQ